MERITRRRFCSDVVAVGAIASIMPYNIVAEDNSELKRIYINNRRYLGNKFKLLHCYPIVEME